MGRRNFLVSLRPAEGSILLLLPEDGFVFKTSGVHEELIYLSGAKIPRSRSPRIISRSSSFGCSLRMRLTSAALSELCSVVIFLAILSKEWVAKILVRLG
jgi:hypothetical protein